jgi:hypothetical protein
MNEPASRSSVELAGRMPVHDPLAFVSILKSPVDEDEFWINIAWIAALA